LIAPLFFYEFLTQDEELEFFGLVEIINHKKNERTGKSSTSVKITERGRELI